MRKWYSRMTIISNYCIIKQVWKGNLFMITKAIVQAKLETLVIKPTRPDMETARRVDLDFTV